MRTKRGTGPPGLLVDGSWLSFRPPLPSPILSPGCARLADRCQAARQLPRRLRPIRRLLGQARQHQLIERRGNRQLGPGRGRRRLSLGVLEQQAHRRVGGEHELPGQQPVGHAAGGIDVGPAVDVGFAQRLLRRDERGRALDARSRG